jgi:alpha-galactosidase
MSPQTRDILTNREAIAVDQDSLGIQGFLFNNRDSVEIWAKPLRGGAWALCFLNRSLTEKKIDFDWKDVVIRDEVFKRELRFDKSTYTIYDIWMKKPAGTTKKPLVHLLPGHDVLFLKISN